MMAHQPLESSAKAVLATPGVKVAVGNGPAGVGRPDGGSSFPLLPLLRTWLYFEAAVRGAVRVDTRAGRPEFMLKFAFALLVLAVPQTVSAQSAAPGLDQLMELAATKKILVLDTAAVLKWASAL